MELGKLLCPDILLVIKIPLHHLGILTPGCTDSLRKRTRIGASRGQHTGKCVATDITGKAPVIRALECKVLKSMVGHLNVKHNQ